MKPSSIVVVVTGLLSLLAFGPATEAEIIYTPANITIKGNASLKLDLNHDGITDLTIVSYGKFLFCGGPLQFNHGPGNFGLVSATPRWGNKVVTGPVGVAAFGWGVEIGPSQSFDNLPQQLMVDYSTCASPEDEGGNWFDVTNRYLGLEFLINGKVHYGWVRLSVSTGRRPFFCVNCLWGPVITLTGYAYENIPGQAIKTGVAWGASLRNPMASPDSLNPGDSAGANPFTIYAREAKPKERTTTC
jgi:hypothetical protein